MPRYRSRTTTQGRNMAGARALWRATGMQDEEREQRAITLFSRGRWDDMRDTFTAYEPPADTPA